MDNKKSKVVQLFATRTPRDPQPAIGGPVSTTGRDHVGNIHVHITAGGAITGNIHIDARQLPPSWLPNHAG